MDTWLPPDLISTHIFPYLPAADIHRSRVLGKCWNLAYLQDAELNALSEVQQTRGGSNPIGFVLKTDRDQANATRGTGILRSFKRLSEAFPGVQAKILATSYGLSCVYLRGSAEFLVTNLLDSNVSVNLNMPLLEEETTRVGMAVFPVEGVRIPEYMVLFPYWPVNLNQADGVPSIRFNVWGSRQRAWLPAQQWLNHIQVVNLQSWDTKNVVQMGAQLYFHLSENDLVCFDLDEGQAEIRDLSAQLLGAEQKALCIWRGELSFMILEAAQIQIYSLHENLWNLVHDIDLQPYIDADRSVFRSLTMELRSRPGPVETPAQAMQGASVVGYAEPSCRLLLRQRGSFVLINLDPMINKTKKGRPRRINPKAAHSNFFFTYYSSLSRVAVAELVN